MAERDENEEYQFGENESTGEVETTELPEEPEHQSNNFLSNPYIRKRAVIVLIIVVFIYILYAMIGSRGDKKSAQFEVPKIQVASSNPVVSQSSPPQQQEQTATQSITTTPTERKDEADLSGRVSELETQKENVSSQVDAINNQVQALGIRIDEQNQKIAALNTTLVAIGEKLDAQAHQLEVITVRSAPAVKHKARHVVRTPAPTYYIQAVIPGRAWLMTRNGKSVTVREGTTLPGYGVVQMIDAVQGRVMTSSGRVIRFSQEDS